MNAKLDFDGAFQRQLVQLLHQDEGFAEAALPYLKPDVFENPVHSWVVKQMRQSLKVDGVVPSALMLRQERRKAERLGIIRQEDQATYKKFLDHKLDLPVPNKTYIKRELQTWLRYQAFKQTVLDVAEKDLPRHDIEAAAKRFSDALDLDVTGDYSPGIDAADSYKDRIRARLRAPEEGITTGIDKLDQIMVSGGLTPKQLGTCIAPTGRGKTNFLINLATQAVMQGVPTLYITLELDERTILDRMDARLTGIPIGELRESAKEIRNKYRSILPMVKGNLRVKEFTPGSTTVGMIKHYIKKLERQGFYPKLLVIDYADLLQPRIEFTDNSYATQGQVYIDLLGLLSELKLVGWTATQGNRSSMSKEAGGDVDMSMMSDSMKKGHLAYVVVAIAQSEKDKKFKRGRIAVLKNRNGPSDREIKVVINHAVCEFRSE